MIKTMSGTNAYGLQHDLQKIVTRFTSEQGDLAVERIDGEEASFERMQEAITSLPFFSANKLVILRAPSAQKRFVENAQALLFDVPETNQLIIVEPKLDKRLSYYKFLKKHTELTDYNQPDENGMAAWLQRSAKDQGGAISSNDARYLIERTGINQQNLSNELSKLLLHDPTVTRQAIDLLTDPNPQSTVFELLEAGFAGNRQRAVALYAEQRAQKVEPQQIIAMLGWQLHLLTIIKTAGDRTVDTIAKDAKQKMFTIQKSQKIARQMDLRYLKSLLAELVDIDTRSKRSALDLDDALQLFLLRLGN